MQTLRPGNSYSQVKPSCTYLQDTCKKNKKRARSMLSCKNTVLQDLQEKFLQEIIPFLVGDFASLQDKYLLAILNVLAKNEFSCINQT